MRLLRVVLLRLAVLTPPSNRKTNVTTASPLAKKKVRLTTMRVG